MGSPSDEDLLAAWREGDESAGNDLVERHVATVLEFFMRRMSREKADDLLQRTFLAVLEARDRVPANVRFKAYLLGIARKQLLMELRRDRTARRSDEDVGEIPAASSLRPSALAAKVAEHERVLAALARIPVKYQVALELYYWEGLATHEMAEVLGLPRDTVKTHLRRASAALESALARVAGSDGG